jgi:hypothetical protein
LCKKKKKKGKVICVVLWMHQTKYFGLFVFLIICASSPIH